ncbi:MAG: JAB domain-containing protein [Bacteroidota bacterium]
MNVKLNEAQKIKVVTSDDVYKIMQQILLRENRLRRAQEHLWIVGLSNQSKLLFIELLALGAQNRAHIKPADAFRMAIYKLATQVVFVHNHPSGSTIPSQADKDLTDYLYKTGKFLEINVIDHLIIAEKQYFSFDDNGLMTKIKTSGVWELVDRTKADLNEMKTEIATEKADKKARIDIAQKLKAAGMSNEEIKKMTKLTLTEIKKL